MMRWRRGAKGAAPGTLFDLDRLGTNPRGQNEAEIRALCAAAYLGDDRAVCRVLGRYKLFVDTGDIGHSTHLMLDGYWEMWLTEAIAAVVRPGMTCVDVGANLGYFTLLMADLVGPAGVVHAFEPNPSIAARLRDSVAVNGFDARTSVHEIALGAEDGMAMLLVVPEREPKNAHVVEATAIVPAGASVRLRRLDSFGELGVPDVVKIDADTSEEAIWHGMAGWFGQRRPMTVFLEFAPARYGDAAAFLGRIEAAGFSLARLSMGDGIEPVTVRDILAGSPIEDQMLVLRR